VKISEIYEENLRRALERATSALRESGCVEGALMYGSIARKQYDSYSDIDLMVMIREQSCMEHLRIILGREFNDSFSMEKDGKIILFPPGLPKVELYIFHNSESNDAKKLFLGSKIADPDDSILFDRNGFLASAVKEWNNTVEIDIKKNAAGEANSFLYYYDIMNSYLMRGDTYRAFFYYNLSFFKLATLVAISKGITDYTYAPPWLTQSVGDDNKKTLEEISTGMFPAKMVSNKDKMLDLFNDTVSSSPELFAEIMDTVTHMSDYLRKKYSGFWRLKDLHHTGYIKEGLLYRSARLDTQPEQKLAKWIKSTGLKTIVDLRSNSELLKHSYSSEIVNSINYVRAPIFSNPDKVNSQYLQLPEEKMKKAYLDTLELKSFKEAVKIVFNLLSDPLNLPLLIHCNAGVDRTGMVVAVILSALGVNKEIIRYDYEMASGLRKGEFIDNIMDSMTARGGVEAFLSEAGTGSYVLENVRKNLLYTEDASGHEL
jgi:protein tyrosine/serine phosphatase/predicted nucleotidyltransferase